MLWAVFPRGVMGALRDECWANSTVYRPEIVWVAAIRGSELWVGGLRINRAVIRNIAVSPFARVFPDVCANARFSWCGPFRTGRLPRRLLGRRY